MFCSWSTRERVTDGGNGWTRTRSDKWRKVSYNCKRGCGDRWKCLELVYIGREVSRRYLGCAMLLGKEGV